MSDPHDLQAIDRLRRFGGDRLVAAMTAAFLGHAPARLDAARTALAASDAAGVRAALHALRSSAAQLGAVGLAERCAAGEAIAGGGSTAGLAELVAAVDADLAAARTWLASATVSADAQGA